MVSEDEFGVPTAWGLANRMVELVRVFQAARLSDSLSKMAAKMHATIRLWQ